MMKLRNSFFCESKLIIHWWFKGSMAARHPIDPWNDTKGYKPQDVLSQPKMEGSALEIAE